jgi:hypothetical protein
LGLAVRGRPMGPGVLDVAQFMPPSAVPSADRREEDRVRLVERVSMGVATRRRKAGMIRGLSGG